MSSNSLRVSNAVGMVLLFLTWLAPSMQAQTTFGNFKGVVTDPTESIIPGATIIVVNKDTNLVRSTTTDALGYYQVTSLNPGVYSITAERTGFTRQVVDEVTLEVNQTIRQDFALQLGEMTETVEVEATASLLQTAEATVGTVITNRDVVDIPLNGRSFVELINLTPGSSPRPQDQSGFIRVGRNAPRSPAINGTRGQDNNYTLDGIENNELSWNFYAQTPSVDAIQEFKVQSGTTSGEFGRAGGATVNVAIKSGTNKFHGNVYNFIRNEKLDARGFFELDLRDEDGNEVPGTARNPLRQNQFGSTFGGPVIKDKTFFFGAYEGMRRRDAFRGNTSIIPTPAQLGGDLSDLPPIFDPLTTCGFGGNPPCALDADGNPILTRQQFSFNGVLNVIDPIRINPAARAYIPLWPEPNFSRPGSPENFLNTAPGEERHDQFHVRVDHQISENTTFFSRVSHQNVSTASPFRLPIHTGFREQRAWNAVMSLTHIFSPKTVVDLKLGYNRNELPAKTPAEGVDRVQFLEQAGIVGLAGELPAETVPSVAIREFASPGGGFTFTGPHSTWQGKGTFRHVFGRHNFSAGFDLRKNHVQFEGGGGDSGFFIFDPLTTADLGNPGGTGSSFASFLLGFPSFANRTIGDTKSHLFDWNYNFFLQDDWRVTDKLNLNLAVRYEYNQWPHDLSDRMSSLEITRDSNGQLIGQLLHVLPNPFPGPLTGINEPGNVRRSIIDPDFNNFAPRVGIAYRLKPRTVIRAGYAIFYSSTYYQQAEDMRQFFPSVTSQGDAIDTTFPTRTIQNAFGDFSVLGFSGWPQNKRNRTSYSQQWNFAMEQQLLKDTALTVTYVGQKGTKLIIYTDINTPPPGPGPVQDRRPVRETVDGFLVGFLNGGENIGTSSYNALQVKLKKRFSQGLQMLNSYTWSKSLDIQSSLFDNTQIQNPNCKKCDWGRSSWDQRQVWVTSFIYELPVGKGRPFLSSAGGVAEALLGGWRASGILAFRSGPPFTLWLPFDNANTGGVGDQRPDLIGDPVLPPGQRTVEGWFNTDSFASPAPFTYGNFGRNVLDGPGEKSLDFSLAKEFNFTESKLLEFRAEFFNLFNHPNFGLPFGGVIPGLFGRIFEQQNDPRQLQFALKFRF